MKILQTNRFAKAVKKLHKNQKEDLDKAIKAISLNVDVGEEKIGDLIGVRVYKFSMQKQLTLLAYVYNESEITLTMLAIGSHENFYRDLKH